MNHCLFWLRNAFTAGYASELSDPVVGCTYPNRPSNIYFSPVGATSVQFLWNYPDSSADNMGNVYFDLTINGTLEQDNVADLNYTKTGLTPMTSYNFTVETVLVCDPAGSATEYDSTVAGLPVMYWAYTKPSYPVLALNGTSTVSTIAVELENPGTNAWISPYDKIRSQNQLFLH